MINPNELIHQIGAAIVTDPEYRDGNWDSIALVYDFVGGQKDRNGYLYRNPDYWEGSLPDDDDRVILKSMLELQSVMEQQMGKKWIKAVVQIKREEQSVDFIFEYDDAKRWHVSPANLEAVVAALKP